MIAAFVTKWAQILDHLDQAGISPIEIARRIHVARTALYRWEDGSEPLHSNGEALLTLHDEHCGIHHCEFKRAHSRARQGSKPQGDQDDGNPEPSAG